MWFSLSSKGRSGREVPGIQVLQGKQEKPESKCTTAGITREQAIAREASLVDTMHALKRPELWVSNGTCTLCGTQQHSTSGMRGACRGNNNRFTCTHKRSTRPIKCPDRTEIQPLQPQLVNCLSGYSPCAKLIRSQEGA